MAVEFLNGVSTDGPGSTAATRDMGGIASGSPTVGTYQVGDQVTAQNGYIFICITAGTPGTWARIPQLSASTAPVALGATAAVGNSTLAATANHVHPNTGLASEPWGYGQTSQPDDGEALIDREKSTGSLTLTASALVLSYFYARRTETITTARFYVAATVGASNTRARVGIYSINIGTGLATLVASTTNDTTLFTGSTYAVRTKALTASWAKTRGTLYAAGFLCVGGTMPAVTGNYITVGGESDPVPRLYGVVTGQADLPATTTPAQSNVGPQLHFVR
jgi:hypothetical protein